MQRTPSVQLPAAVVEARLEPEVDLRQNELHPPLRAQVVQHDRLAAAQEGRRLLVGRCALVPALVHILSQQRLACPHPAVVVGAGEADAGLPVAGDDAEARGRRAVAPSADQPLRVLDIRQREPLRVA